MDKLNEHVKSNNTETTLSQFESEEDYRKMMIEERIFILMASFLQVFLLSFA